MQLKSNIVIDSLWDNKNVPGAIKYWTYLSDQNNVYGFNFACPCGCGRIGSVRFVRVGMVGGWNWNGTKRLPTITPSIDLQTSDANGNPISHWHGFLTNGVWNSV